MSSSEVFRRLAQAGIRHIAAVGCDVSKTEARTMRWKSEREFGSQQLS